MDEVKVGIVGIGWWSDVLADVIARSDKLDLRACFTRSEDKAADFAAKFDCDAVKSYEAMLALDDLDGVILTTPNSAHRPGAEAAARAAFPPVTDPEAAPLRTDAMSRTRSQPCAGASLER